MPIRNRLALSSALLVALATPAFADVVWVTNPDIPTVFSAYPLGPSVESPTIDREIADDFNVIGSIERIVADGLRCLGCSGYPETIGVTVRFFAWTAEGPGALQSEQFIPLDDPRFFWSPSCCMKVLDITLPEPFIASGWHFFSVQPLLAEGGPSDEWHFYRSNVGDPMGAPAFLRDEGAGEDWIPFHETVGYPAADASFELYGVSTGDPGTTILTVTSPAITPSARVRIDGDQFGAAPNGRTIRIGGIEAITTNWTEDTIIAYVPESSPIGTVSVEIVEEDGSLLDEVAIDVVPRTADGRVKWRFAIDADYAYHRVGLAPDGSVYASDVAGRLYKLSANGALEWIVDALRGQAGGAAEGPVVVGPDGTVYVAVNPLGPATELVAYNADGELQWVFTDPAAWTVAVGPAIGPDGHIYVAFQAPGGTSLGLVSLTADGSVRFSNLGAPTLYEHGAVGAELAFGASTFGGPVDHVVLTVDRDDDPFLYAFRMSDGAQRFAVPRGVTEDLFLQFQIQPDVGPDGTIYMSEFTGASGLGWGLKAFDPFDGSVLWRFDPDIISGASGPAIGPDGMVYFSWDISRVSKVTPAGEEVWRHVDFGGIRSRPGASPANDLVLVAGGDFGQPGRFKALDVATGEETWRIDLPHENGDVIPDAGPTFTPDGATAYYPTVILADPPAFEYSYIYALDLTDGVPGDVTGDGVVDFADLLAVLGTWGPCTECPEDVDGSGEVDFGDLLIVLSAWS